LPEWKAFVDASLTPRMVARNVESFRADAAPDAPIGSFGQKGLVPTVSFGGLGRGTKGIGALVSFATENQAKIEDRHRESLAQKPPLPTTPSFTGTNLLLGVGLNKGIGSTGASFTIPTLYQADPPSGALIC
jgi:hypothetical protein